MGQRRWTGGGEIPQSAAALQVQEQKSCDEQISGTSDMLCTCVLPTEPGLLRNTAHVLVLDSTCAHSLCCRRGRNNRCAFDYDSRRSNLANLHDDYDDPLVDSAVLRRLRDVAGHRRSHLRPCDSIWIFRYWQRPYETQSSTDNIGKSGVA